MNQNNEDKSKLLGFLSLYETSNHDGYLGVVLITDLQGIPQEFRCTHPVKPTIIQKPLYGNTLIPHIGINMCGIPLIQSIQSNPSVIMVDKQYLLGVRSSSPYPVIFIRRFGEAIEIKTSSSSAETKMVRERLDCTTGRFQPIMFEPHSDFNDDIAPAKVILERIFSYLDPLEPFQRMIKAIEILGKQDTRFQ